MKKMRVLSILAMALLLAAGLAAQEAPPAADGAPGSTDQPSTDQPPEVRALELRVAALEAELQRLRKVAESRQRSAEASAALVEAMGLQDAAAQAAEAWRTYCAGAGEGLTGCGAPGAGR